MIRYDTGQLLEMKNLRIIIIQGYATGELNVKQDFLTPRSKLLLL